jgi:serine phosphatase RsbU (regulator of sigma subunit)
LSGVYNQTWGTAQQWVRLLDVVLFGVVAIVIAEVRISRERRFARVSAIAEVAQRAILPILPKSAAGVGVSARYQSAFEDAVVGGDLYDCSLAGPRVRFLVGDVRGKGISAIEQAARVIRAFRQSAVSQSTLGGVAADMDAYLTPFMGIEDFATAVLVEVTDEGAITLVSCGHPPPLLVRAGGAAELLSLPSGLPLGLGAGGQAVTIAWAAGDRVLLYTDGLSEARDGQGEFLPMSECVPDLAAQTGEAALDAVLDRVHQHVNRGHLGDDLALVLLENGALSPAAGEEGGLVSARAATPSVPKSHAAPAGPGRSPASVGDVTAVSALLAAQGPCRCARVHRTHQLPARLCVLP